MGDTTISFDPQVKIDLYRTMLRIRMVEERIADLYAEQEMRCPVHLYIGQEAVATGVCANLTHQDYLFGTYRSHGIYLAKGGELRALIAELYGKATGATRGRGGSMQLVAPEAGLLCTSAIVGGTIPMAVGAGLTAMMEGSGRVSVIVLGDGGTEEGIFHESMNFAALKSLPVVFVCENNLYACYSHQSARQSADNIDARASAYGMPGHRVDGHDVLAVHEAAAAAVDRARSGQGPSLLECRTYRYREHVGPNFDLDLGYRSQEEFDAWLKRDPVMTFKELLLREGLLSKGKQAQMAIELAHEIDEAVAFAQASPFPNTTELWDHVYA